MNRHLPSRHPLSRRRPSRAAIIRQLDDQVVKRGMRLLLRLGVAPNAFALVETTGRRTGLPRQTPVGNGLIDDTFWLIAARGEAAHYVRNLRDTPGVRVKIGRTWSRGIAEVLPDDNPDQRLAQILANFGWLRRLDAKALESSIRLLGTTPVVVRITLGGAS
ncbi:nitroreductase family deazaflavin-dependent oxidoreductase [Ornithinimicrobium faecis]|uniref:Nitroreductase family deazaflavin-dependent oxidoreductase n=1 Tax=Ornithinimicrobium faecis TaxID=2934158 RepID=A0ABY4YU73_9MICO|nr:nitroreductase/quinone reductase family protein [Ornithinimicrobium sp. HY1793]USQ80166.1 nitroreductase family deazaflavin-dependent oxidoreductase [Ornithinimicrobium sp. HY1793]